MSLANEDKEIIKNFYKTESYEQIEARVPHIPKAYVRGYINILRGRDDGKLVGFQKQSLSRGPVKIPSQHGRRFYKEKTKYYHDYIHDNYKISTPEAIAKHLGIKKHYVHQIASKIGVTTGKGGRPNGSRKKEPNVTAAVIVKQGNNYDGKFGRQYYLLGKNRHHQLTEEEQDVLHDYYDSKGPKWCAEKLNKPYHVIQYFARQLNLQKRTRGIPKPYQDVTLDVKSPTNYGAYALAIAILIGVAVLALKH